MKKAVMMGAFLFAVASFSAQAQTISTGNSGTTNATNGSVPQNGIMDSASTTNSTTGRGRNARMNRRPGNMNSMSGDSMSTQGRGRNRDMRRNRMRSDSSSGNMQRPQ